VIPLPPLFSVLSWAVFVERYIYTHLLVVFDGPPFRLSSCGPHHWHIVAPKAIVKSQTRASNQHHSQSSLPVRIYFSLSFQNCLAFAPLLILSHRTITHTHNVCLYIVQIDIRFGWVLDVLSHCAYGAVWLLKCEGTRHRTWFASAPFPADRSRQPRWI
jgi:hypothetical protein